jgi:xanthine dehydrogenase accessory factor
VNRWIESVTEDCVLVTVAAVRGSAPREPGARMVVTRERVVETIGGGNLEHAAIERAREMLDAGSAQPTQLVRYPLGPGLRQCCGGVATLLYERIADAWWVARLAELDRSGKPGVVITGAEGACRGRKLIVSETGCEGSLGETVLDEQALALARDVLEPQLRAIGSGNLALIEPRRPCDFHVVLFGAGHVGRALVAVLAGVDCRVTWVDSRRDQFPGEVPGNVRVVAAAAPEEEVDRAPSGAFFLVMTHSHALDFELCERALKRGDFRYLGLIGSLPKRNRFLKYLKLEGVSEAALARLTCPIGVPGIAGKQPSAIAIAIAAELLQVRDRRRMGNETRHSAT